MRGSRGKAYARGSGGSRCCGECAPALRQLCASFAPALRQLCASFAPALLGGLADQDVVGNRSGAGADAEESIERRMACAAAIEAEHELIKVVLLVFRSP